MKWFWTKTPTPEKRAGQGYTDAIITAITSQINSAAAGNTLTTGPLELCVGAYARAFENATVHASDMLKEVLIPSLLGNVARSMVQRGASMYLIVIEAGKIRLLPVGSWDISGSGANPSSWKVRADIFGPSSNETVYVGYDSVLHFIHSFHESKPSVGVSPLQWASTTGALMASLETRLSQEAGSASGYFLPWPTSPNDDDVDEDSTTPGVLAALKKDIGEAKGKTIVIEATSTGHGDKAAGTKKDLEVSRFGFDAPEVMRTLRKDVSETVMNVLGCPPSLFVDSTGTAARESLRRFVMSSCEPLAAKISEQLSIKLESPVKLSFENLWAHDLAGRAQALRGMVTAGMELSKAMELSGLMSEED